MLASSSPTFLASLGDNSEKEKEISSETRRDSATKVSCTYGYGQIKVQFATELPWNSITRKG